VKGKGGGKRGDKREKRRGGGRREGEKMRGEAYSTEEVSCQSWLGMCSSE